MEEIRRIAPGYQGSRRILIQRRLASRQSRKLGRLMDQRVQWSRQRERWIRTSIQQTRSDMILADSIFGMYVTIVAIDPREDFPPRSQGCSKLRWKHSMCRGWKANRVLAKEIYYYATRPLWLRLIDVKIKQGL